MAERGLDLHALLSIWMKKRSYIGGIPVAIQVLAAILAKTSFISFVSFHWDCLSRCGRLGRLEFARRWPL